MKSSNQEQRVRRYYDRNTSWFLGLSRRKSPKAIHQPLYITKDQSLEDALHTQHEQILHEIQKIQAANAILDLGCGVGESMMYLAKHTPKHLKYHGITISGTQASEAVQRVSMSSLSDRITIIEGSFLAIPMTIPQVDLTYAIESFIHTPDASTFFKEAARSLKHNGRLVLFDDFLRNQNHSRDEAAILEDLKNGWLANTLLTSDAVKALAAEHDLQYVSRTDYTRSLRLGRFRDQFVRFLTPFARLFISQSQYCRFLIGGDARQRAYEREMLRYEMLVFIKS